MKRTTQLQPVLIGGEWRDSSARDSFHATNPQTKEPLDEVYPVSTWTDCDAALSAALEAHNALRACKGAQVAEFLELFAQRIESRSDDLVQAAHLETAFPIKPRLADVELPRTTNQLRQSAASARDGSWRAATIDTQANIRSYLAPIGPVAVFGPNNFPLAFGSVSGGDFAAAIAAGNPVIGKANTSHPRTTQILAEEAKSAVDASGLPPATVQLIYRTSHSDGERFVADPRLGATGYTGSRSAGLKLKAAADHAGNPIFLELSSINPVLVLPGALRERPSQIAEEFTTSCLMGTGQFCTNPSLVVLMESAESEELIKTVVERFNAAPSGTLLSGAVESSLRKGVQRLCEAGAEVLTKSGENETSGFSITNTILRASGAAFLAKPDDLQTEVFGNASLFVVTKDAEQTLAVLDALEGNLTGCLYSDTSGSDDDLYVRLAPVLHERVGRLLNDKMPTGVAVSPAMNHGGPYPATGNPRFSAVGVPAALERFAKLQCFDNVRPERLPPLLQDSNPSGAWRLVDGDWTRKDVPKN